MLVHGWPRPYFTQMVPGFWLTWPHDIYDQMQHQDPCPLSRAESMSQTRLTPLLIYSIILITERLEYTFTTNSSRLARSGAIYGNQWPCSFVYTYIPRSGPARWAPFVETNGDTPVCELVCFAAPYWAPFVALPLLVPQAISLLTASLSPVHMACMRDLSRVALISASSSLDEGSISL